MTNNKEKVFPNIKWGKRPPIHFSIGNIWVGGGGGNVQWRKSIPLFVHPLWPHKNPWERLSLSSCDCSYSTYYFKRIQTTISTYKLFFINIIVSTWVFFLDNLNLLYTIDYISVVPTFQALSFVFSLATKSFNWSLSGLKHFTARQKAFSCSMALESSGSVHFVSWRNFTC